MDAFLNSFVVGDNLELLKQIPDNSIDLVYTDPIYGTGRNFHDYDDRFESITAYQEFIEPRLEQCARVLRKSGVIVVHVEPRISHIIRNILDKYFGFNKFVNEIVWKTGGHAKNKYQLGRHHDTIIVYSKSSKYTFNPLYKPYDDKYMASNKPKYDEAHNKYFITTAAHNSKPDVNPRPNLRYEWNGNQQQWYVTKEKMQALHDADRLTYNAKGIPRFKKFIEDMDGIPVNDWFDDISNVQKSEKLDYATQKPIKLLDRILHLFSNKDDVVLDIFAGSGTVGRSALHLQRAYILFDISEKAKQIFENSIAS